MSILDAVKIGLSIVQTGLGIFGGGDSDSTPKKSGLPPLDNTKFMSKRSSGNGLSQSQKRSMDKTAVAQTVRQKKEGLDNPQSEEGTDAIELALQWDEVFNNETG